MQTSTSQIVKRVESLWNDADARAVSGLDELVYRSNLLGADRSVANYGGGNTSVKSTETDHTGRETTVMWVKGSGSDLATITRQGFTGLRLDEVTPLLSRLEMSDEDMVAYLARCQLEPAMPRPSIETLLHAFVPYPHVDHTHPDATNIICCSQNGEELARECFGDDVVWIPYIRPGFTLSKWVGEAVRNNPRAKAVLLAKHGLVTWGDTGNESYSRTIEMINRAANFVAERTLDKPPFGGQRIAPLSASDREALLFDILPKLRGMLSSVHSQILTVDTSDEVMEMVCGADTTRISQIGAACPDHLVHTKMRPLWLDFDPSSESAGDLTGKLSDGIARYQAEYSAWFERNSKRREGMSDPSPRVILIPGVGMVTADKNVKSSAISRDLYHRAISVMRGASALDTFVSLTEEESFAVEYWPLELYKLTLAPPPGELTGKVALVTGGAGGIGSAICETLSSKGAVPVVADLDVNGSRAVVEQLGTGKAILMDVTSEDAVVHAYRDTVLAYGGVDVVVSNAGLASSAPVEETSIELWDRNQNVLSKGYFLVAREAFKVLKRQGTGGALIFIASKNSLVGGKNATAYSSAKALELHLARCLAEEGGEFGIRVNTVNPDAVLQGSKIWQSSWREERARSYGIKPEELDEYYRQRTTLKVNIFPEDIAEAVLFFASSQRSGKSTGNVLNVDGGVAAAFPR